ncbi:MAG: ComEA family DNA-binding protein, partial [Candidatus Paceibacterota bacterium]
EANGLAKSADREFFQRNFNLARVLADQEKVYIPSKEEVKEGLFKESVFVLAGETTSFSANSTGSVAGASEATDLVNVNTAAKSDLETLPGIGPVTADKIIEGRPYSSIQGLMDEKVVNKGQWEKIKDKITI